MVKTVRTPSFAYEVFNRNELSCWQSPAKRTRKRRKRVSSATPAPVSTKPAPVPVRLGVSLVNR